MLLSLFRLVMDCISRLENSCRGMQWFQANAVLNFLWEEDSFDQNSFDLYVIFLSSESFRNSVFHHTHVVWKRRENTYWLQRQKLLIRFNMFLLKSFATYQEYVKGEGPHITIPDCVKDRIIFNSLKGKFVISSTLTEYLLGNSLYL